jgi:hypothetical protein
MTAVHELIDEAVAARRSAAALSLRQQRELLVTQSFDEAFAEDLADAYARATPDEPTRKLYARRFEQFRDWVRPDQVSALPAAGATVASYLIHLALDGTSLPQIKAAASAIEWFHDVHGSYLDRAYIQAALAVAAKLLSPDGGGGEEKPVSLASRNQIMGSDEMPLAAGGA